MIIQAAFLNQILFINSFIDCIWLLSFLFILTAAAVMLYIMLYTNRLRKRKLSNNALRLLFSDLISEIIICDSEVEMEELLQLPHHQALISQQLNLPYAKQIFIRQLVESKHNLSGLSAGNLQWLFKKLQLDKHTLQIFSSGKWHKKVQAIQQMAEMHESKQLIKIYRETNNKNFYIRTEAQIAVVKLTGFQGLRFLNIVSYPVTQWQQLCLLNHVKEQDIDLEKIKKWLLAKNETVVEFALRFIEVYKCYDLQQEVLQCLQSSSVHICRQALQTLKEIADSSSIASLIEFYANCAKEEKLFTIELIAQLSDSEIDLTFLSQLVSEDDEAIRIKASSGLEKYLPLLASMHSTQSALALTALHLPIKKAV